MEQLVEKFKEKKILGNDLLKFLTKVLGGRISLALTHSPFKDKSSGTRVSILLIYHLA